MAHYDSESLGVSFDLPDTVPVRQQLLYRGAVAGVTWTDDAFIRYWGGALKLFQNWECELIPDPNLLDLDTEDDPTVADIVQFACNIVAGHMAKLERTPKNS